MKKSEDGTAPEWRYYPHIVSGGAGANRRHDIHVTNQPLPKDRIHWHAAYAFWCEGAVDADDKVTAKGRAAILAKLRADMHPSSEMCVVWGPGECTYVTRHGTMDSDDPPIGQPRDTAAITRLKAVDIEGAVLDLPEGCAASHLFIRRLSHDRIEIATAAPMWLYDRLEPVRPGETDPVAGCYALDGSFRLPRFLMGVEVTGEDDGMLLGPVQPDGVGSRVVEAWPSKVAEACVELAQRPLDAALVQRAWRAAEKMERPLIHLGVRLAA